MKSRRPDPALAPPPADAARGIPPIAAPGAPPPAAAAGRVVCADLDLRIDRDGVWYYHGSPILRKELVCLFASVLTRDDDGRYWLVTPTEVGPVRVDDAPFLAVELFEAGSGRDQVLTLRTNVDQLVTVDDAHSLHVLTDPDTDEPSPYVRLDGGMEARIARAVYYDLVARGVEEEIAGELFFGVWSKGTFFPLGTLEARS
ncbi:MAG: DUF1285 domain-containing protein [Rhodospirillales bacterium]